MAKYASNSILKAPTNGGIPTMTETGNLPPYDTGNRYLFGQTPVDITTDFVPINGRVVYVLTFRQAGTTFTLPIADANMLQTLGNKLLTDSANLARPSGLYLPNGNPVTPVTD